MGRTKDYSSSVETHIFVSSLFANTTGCVLSSFQWLEADTKTYLR